MLPLYLSNALLIQPKGIGYFLFYLYVILLFTFFKCDFFFSAIM